MVHLLIPSAAPCSAYTSINPTPHPRTESPTIFPTRHPNSWKGDTRSLMSGDLSRRFSKIPSQSLTHIPSRTVIWFPSDSSIRIGRVRLMVWSRTRISSGIIAMDRLLIWWHWLNVLIRRRMGGLVVYLIRRLWILRRRVSLGGRVLRFGRWFSTQRIVIRCFRLITWWYIDSWVVSNWARLAFHHNIELLLFPVSE